MHTRHLFKKDLFKYLSNLNRTYSIFQIIERKKMFQIKVSMDIQFDIIFLRGHIEGNFIFF